MPEACSLLLEVFSPHSIYDAAAEVLDWEVSSDPAHETPYLIAPKNYAAQDIDPIKCTASIGTVEIGVIDVPQVLGDQSTGWMTARVHDVRGRRCRLRRWINDTVGWVVIADGPAGPPRMDPSYAAYSWTIRDTRETERKLDAFLTGGVACICPRLPLYGFGRWTDDDGDHILLGRALDNFITGDYFVIDSPSGLTGLVDLAGHFSDQTVVDQASQDAIQIMQVASGVWAARNADVLWRVHGTIPWNVARPSSPDNTRQPFVGLTDGTDSHGNDVQMAAFVTLWNERSAPAGFPSVGESIDLILRYRGPASTDFPYYVEGPLGSILEDLYTGIFTLIPLREITGFVYDPEGLDSAGVGYTTRIRYNPTVFDQMTDQVLLRVTAPIADSRSWAETALYGPSGWIPTLDADMLIAPISRSLPNFVDRTLDDDVTVPSPNWQTGEVTISHIIYHYPRYFIPDDPSISTDPDGLATRDVFLEFDDGDSELRFGAQIQEYDASAFGAIGTPKGINLPGILETASLQAQNAKFDVLDRYREGAQSITVSARRDRIPGVRVGDWVPWALMHLPDRLTGLRGSNADLAQILSLRDDDCTWRTLVLEESGLAAGAPGFFKSLVEIGDDPGAGGMSLSVLSDVESY